MRQVSQTVDRRLEQLVGRNVGGELVVLHLDGDRQTKAPAQLFVDANTPAHDLQRLLASLIALQEAAAGGLVHPVVEQADHGLRQIGDYPNVNARGEHGAAARARRRSGRSPAGRIPWARSRW